MPKRKTSFNNDLQEKYPAFRKGRDEYEAECIVTKYSCAQTKTEAIINNVLAPYCVEYVLSELKEHNIEYIGVVTDGSNHKAIKL